MTASIIFASSELTSSTNSAGSAGESAGASAFVLIVIVTGGAARGLSGGAGAGSRGAIPSGDRANGFGRSPGGGYSGGRGVNVIRSRGICGATGSADRSETTRRANAESPDSGGRSPAADGSRGESYGFGTYTGNAAGRG